MIRGDGWRWSKPMTGRRAIVSNTLWPGISVSTPHAIERKKRRSVAGSYIRTDGTSRGLPQQAPEMYRGWREHIAADVADTVREPHRIDPLIAASLLQALVHGLSVQLMVDPDAFDRPAMFDACVRLLAPVFETTTSSDSKSRK